MKNKNFTKFTKRNTHKRNSKNKAREALLRAARECGVNADGAKISLSSDNGRRARVSSNPGRDERVAEGVFAGSRGGYGFVRLEDGDIFIPEGKCFGAIDGDLVEIVYHYYQGRFGEKKTEGRVRKIVEYGKKYLVGEIDEQYFRHGRRSFVRRVFVPDGGKVYPYPEVVGGVECSPGDKVEVRLIRGDRLECEVVTSFGPSDSREANYGAILAECEIETEFSHEELLAAEAAAGETLSDEGRVRRDGEIIFTIDGEGAKDLDDAVSLVRTDFGYRLGVHIADVSHYVRERTPLDRCVMRRGTSVYFTDKVVPMLPPSLSNGACSLNAGEDKYALSAIIDLDKNGEILSLSLESSIIKSRVRGVYSEVNALLAGAASEEITEKYSGVINTLRLMEELYRILEERHTKRGAVDFDREESVIILDGTGDPVEIAPRERGVGEKMIEQFMLAANEAVAGYLYEREIPAVYRIHEPPPRDKLEEFVTFAHNLGFDTSYIRRDGPDSRSFARLLREAEKRGLSEPVSYSMLRAMSKAKYSDIRSPHFGLGIENYCHFTSPIRRLGDLATHRIIKSAVLGEKPPRAYAQYARRAAAAATEGELRAMSAERKIEDLYKCIYMSRFIGECRWGFVSSVTRFGLFVRLENTCEGFIPISEMPGEFRFDEKNVTLTGKNKVFRLCDRLKIRVEECDVSGGKIRFSLVEWETEKKR